MQSLTKAISIGILTSLFASLCPSGIAESTSVDSPKSDSTKSDLQPGKTTPESAKSASPISKTKTTVTKVEKGPYDEVNQRMNDLERRIIEASSSGRLNPQQASDLKKRIDLVSELEAKFRAEDSKFSHWQLVKLDLLLDHVNASLEADMADRDLASVDLQFVRHDLLARINTAATHAQLTAAEVTDLKQRFNRIIALETSILKQQGRLSYADKLMLNIDFDHLSEELNRQMGDAHISLPEIEKASSNLELKIQEGLKTGKISEKQAEEFRKTLSELKTAESEIQKSSLTDREQLIEIGLAGESIANQIARLMESPQSLNARIAKTDRRLAAALDAGELSPIEVMQLKEDLDEIVAAGTTSSTNTTTDTKENLAGLQLDVARLETRLDRQIHSPSRVWPGITAFLVNLGSRAKLALDSKRLSDEDAKSTDADIAKLTNRKNHLETAAGGMTAGQALELAEDSERLAARLEKAMKDREMVLPDIEALSKAINNRIAEATMSGDLDSGEARSAVLALGEINSLKERLKISDNGLSSREIFNLAFELERLASTIEEEVHGHSPFFPGIDTRRAQIEALIEEGISSGRLNTAEAVLLKTTVAETSALEKQYRADSLGLTAEKALELVGNLEREWQDLDRQLREQAVMTSDLISLEGSAEKKLRQGFSYGLLTRAESESLRNSYDSVVNAFNKWRANEGGLSYGERLAFAYGFQRLNASTERQLRVVPLLAPSIESQRAQAEQRLGAVLASGHIPVTEAQDLKSLLDEIMANANSKRRSGGGLSYQESQVISIDLDRLNNRIEERVRNLKSPLPDIDTRQAELDKSINYGLSKGTLSPDDAKFLRQELDRVAMAEAAFRISDESLNYAEAINLVQDLERIKQRLASLSSKKVVTAPAKESNKKSSTPK